MTTVTELEDAYRTGYAEGYDGAISALMMLAEVVRQDPWPKSFLMKFLYMAQNLTDEQMMDAILKHEDQLLH
jgi:hypothetical protein